MSTFNYNEFDEKLLELNNWQIEQQKKLKLFQEAQRVLLDTEHEKILSSLKTLNYEQRHLNEKDPEQLLNLQDIENEPDIQSNKSAHANFLFNIKANDIKLKNPNFNLNSISNFQQQEKLDELKLDDFDNVEKESDYKKTKKFLRRGDGLARFRMKIDDFKAPPDIYKEKRIRTYLNSKPEFSKRNIHSKLVRSANDVSKNKKPSNTFNKTRPVPVNIYVAESKNKNKNTYSAGNMCDSKRNKLSQCPKKKEALPSKTAVKSLILKPFVCPTYNKNQLEKQNSDKINEKPADKPQKVTHSPEKKSIESLIKKDEKELKMFEILEGKIDDGSLSPNSSLVAKFFNESLSSTPSKVVIEENENDFASSYMESLRILQRQYLSEEQINRIRERNEDEECNVESQTENDIFYNHIKNINSNNDNNNDNGNSNNNSHNSNNNNIGDSDMKEVKKNEISQKDFENNCEMLQQDNINELKETYEEELAESQREISLEVESLKNNKTLLQDYITNFKNFKNEITETFNQSESDEASESLADANKAECFNKKICSQREIAVVLQRKALQDNVKTLLNWEGVSRKKPVKKVIRKVKAKQGKIEKSKKFEKNEDEKHGDLLKNKLEELEKEIEIFKRENKTLTQLQKDCLLEKSKLEKERKEFNAYVELEKEKYEKKITEEQKKLQRERNVFEKYCKHIRNQPNKKEREEITNLKKEVEKLTETIVTKDSRWGASQARLRNQIKSLEKENAELKSEIEKLKKQTTRKVTFESGKNINTKIIHAINSEIGKLKSHLIKNEKYQSLTARRNSERPKNTIRRIKSVPNLKDAEDKVNCEVTEIPTTVFAEMENVESDAQQFRTDACSSGTYQENIDFNSENTSSVTKLNLNSTTKLNVDNPSKLEANIGQNKDATEIVLHETLFENSNCGNHNIISGTICEIKRRLENLNLLNRSNSLNGEADREGETSSERRLGVFDDSGSESSEISDDFGREDDKNFSNKLHHIAKYNDGDRNCLGNQSVNGSNLHQTKITEQGVREKVFEDGRKEIFYPNGNIKKISPDSRIIKMIYYNGDVKETDVVEGSEKYFYAETKTWHTTYKEGLEVLEFPNGQTERRLPDGSTQILFPNGCVRYCDPSGKDEWRFVDGTIIKTDKNGHKVLVLPNGQREIHTKEYKRREYPDGTVKFLYSDGTQETRYASGRVRLKDKDGNLVMDSGGIR